METTMLRTKTMTPLLESPHHRTHDDLNEFRAYPSESYMTAVNERLQRSSRTASTRSGGKSVSFATKCAVRLIPTHDELTDDEFLSTYYTAEEKREIMTENVDIIRALHKCYSQRDINNNCNGANNSEMDLCSRGLEAMIDRSELEERTAAKRSCMNAVLDLQYRQYEEGYSNLEEMSQASRRISEGLVQLSIDRAETDASFVRQERALATRRIMELMGDKFLTGMPEDDHQISNQERANNKWLLPAQGSDRMTQRRSMQRMGMGPQA